MTAVTDPPRRTPPTPTYADLGDRGERRGATAMAMEFEGASLLRVGVEDRNLAP